MKKILFLLGILLLLAGCDFLFPEEEESYIVEVRADAGVNVLPQSIVLGPGEIATFSYSLKEGYVLNGITINGVSVTPSSNKTFSVIANTPTQTVVVSTEELKQEFVISAIAGPNGNISPSGDIKIIEGEDKTFWINPDAGFLTETLRVDGQEVALSTSYTFSNVASNKKIEATFKKDSILWPLLNIEWSLDSVYIDDNKYYTAGEEILNFYPGGKYTIFWNGKLYERTGWVVDKSKTPAILTYEGRYVPIELLNEKKFIFSYINANKQKVTQIYVNHGYK